MFSSENQEEVKIDPFYKIGLSGIKDKYAIGEELTFSLFLNGYGSECGSYEVQITKEGRQIEGREINIECTEKTAKVFENINVDITTLTLILSEPGIYIVTGEFSNKNGEKFQDKKNIEVS